MILILRFNDWVIQLYKEDIYLALKNDHAMFT